ncbi:MAG: molybdopterin cofactor-binding domain-containing protein, partial [Bacteroidota bacterium]
MELASEHLKTPIANLTTENGVVFDKTSKKSRVSYAELAKGKRIERRLPEAVTIKKPSEFKIMSKPVTRRDGRDKVTGKAKFAGDIQLPGMLYAKILRPPAHGAKLIDVDVSEAKQVVYDPIGSKTRRAEAQIIQQGDLVAVLHKYPDVAEVALSKIKARFDKPQSDVDDKSIFDHLLKLAPEGRVVAKDGNLQEGQTGAKAVFEESYFNDYVAHAPIEPHTAVVRIEGNKATVWASTQTPFSVREEVAEVLGFPPENVRVISPFVGGGFGGKTRNLQAAEAARLAKLSGKPVQVAWTRKEEFFYDSFRPAAVVKIKSGIT